MKKIVLFVVVLLLGFYAGWPAFNGYQIHKGLKAGDTALLDQKIDFVSVRTSMREPVMRQVRSRIDSVMKDLGPVSGLIGDSISTNRVDQIIDGALKDVVNPEELSAIYARGGDVSSSLQTAVLRQINDMGGLIALFKKGTSTAQDDNNSGGTNGFGSVLGGLLKNKQVQDAVGQVATQALDPKKIAKMLFPKSSKTASAKSTGGSFGLSNIKSFGFAGPLGLQLGVARDGAATGPDVTAQMDFTGSDWRVTKLIPNLIER